MVIKYFVSKVNPLKGLLIFKKLNYIMKLKPKHFFILFLFNVSVYSQDIFTPKQLETLHNKAYDIYFSNDEFQKSIKSTVSKLAFNQWQEDQFKKIKIDNAEISNWYDTNNEKLRIPFKAKLRHILVNSQLAAEDLSNKLVSSPINQRFNAFLYAVKTYSLDKNDNQNGGLIGWEIPERFNKIYPLKLEEKKAGDIFAVKNKFGWHVILVEATESSKKPSLKESIKTIENILKREKLIEILKNNL